MQPHEPSSRLIWNSFNYKRKKKGINFLTYLRNLEVYLDSGMAGSRLFRPRRQEEISLHLSALLLLLASVLGQMGSSPLW